MRRGPRRPPGAPRTTARTAITTIDAARPAPPADCPLCPRLRAFRDASRAAEPGWFNAPVPTFGPPNAALLVVGLAPGLRGANRTGRPFTGDYAGEILYAALSEHGFSRGTFAARPDDGLELVDCRIVNAVRCVPPQNRPTPAEINTCRRFLTPQLAEGPAPKVVLALGRIAHETVLRAVGLAVSRHPFGHGREYALPSGRVMIGSYHTSRYNVNTGVLTPAMFDLIVARAAALAAGSG